MLAFHLFFHAKDRFHLPIEPVIAILATVALGPDVRLAHTSIRPTKMKVTRLRSRHERDSQALFLSGYK